MFQVISMAGNGGAREGAGKPPNWLREECRKSSARIDTVSILEGIIKDSRRTARERLDAIQMLWDRGFGKAPQSIEMSGDIGSILLIRSHSENENGVSQLQH